jgi:phospholipid/cholesterol/gamma-HCH transport system substrate-binding protein
MSPARLAGIGAFVVGGVLLFTLALFMIGDRQMAFARKFVVYTEFATITGLQPGAIVRVSGARGGSVEAIEPPRDPAGKFRVRLEIAEDLHQLVRTDSVAAIETEGLVGGSFLAIATGSPQAPEAPPGSTIAGREPFLIADLLQQMSDTIAKVNATIDTVKGGVEEAVASINETVTNANALIEDVSDDVKTMASAGARISGHVAEISEGIRRGDGTIGKLVKDDELYTRVTNIAEQVEQVASEARRVVQRAREAIDSFQSSSEPVAGVASNLNQTLVEARTAMAAFADNMEALSHNFLFRGFFNDRGYFDLSDISPAAYRAGALTAGGDRTATRIWLHERVLFEPAENQSGDEERLTESGKGRLDSAIAAYLDRIADGVLIIEGYADGATQDERYLASRKRASIVRDHLIGKFDLDPRGTGVMPLGSEAAGSPVGTEWSGIALALFVEKP